MLKRNVNTKPFIDLCKANNNNNTKKACTMRPDRTVITAFKEEEIKSYAMTGPRS